MIEVDIQTFVNLVEEAWVELPTEWIEKLNEANISYEIADLGNIDQIKKVSISDPWNLLGMYSGVPQIMRHKGFEPFAMPDRIILFRKPILLRTRDLEHLRKIVTHVLYHEIGHYFGLSEDELRSVQSDPF